VEVRWGQQTFEEMMIGFLEIAPAAKGVVSHTPWWKPLVNRIRLESLARVAATLINLCLLCALALATLRARARVAAAAAFGSSASAEDAHHRDKSLDSI
jgi:hypothetical protein